MSGVTEKFLRYVKVDTESVQDAEQFPSSEKQKDLARLLAEELRALFPEAEFSAAPVGPVIAINIGLGAVGVSWIR